jgi:hypothetical protein
MPTFEQTALLGTGRSDGTPGAPHPALDDAWRALDWTGAREIAFLDAAALVATARCAGFPLMAGAALPPPASADPRPAAPPAAAAILRRVLDDELRPLLVEWLDICARAGCVVPPFLLPAILRACRRDERAPVAAVAGERGAWLARLNADWDWLVNSGRPHDPALWETGTPAERLACLAAFRRTDPAQARQRLEATWKDEAPDFREAAIACLESGLSNDDETFLERCLADRRRETRQRAQVLLARLAASAFASRMRSRAEACVAFERGFLSKKLEVRLPPAFDPEWKADGIEEKPPARTGEKAFWVRQIVALIPASHWNEKFSTNAGDIVALARKGEWGDLLVEAWLRSLEVAPDPAWSAALFEPVLVDAKSPPGGMSAPDAAGLLLRDCPAADRWKLVDRFGDRDVVSWACLPHLGPAPSDGVAYAVFKHIARALRDGSFPGGSPQAVAVARWFSPAMRADAARLLKRDSGLSRPAESFLQALDVRAAMPAAFGRHPSPEP